MQKPPAHVPCPEQVFCTLHLPSAPTLQHGSQPAHTPDFASQAPPLPHETGVPQFAPVKQGGHTQLPSDAHVPPFRQFGRGELQSKPAKQVAQAQRPVARPHVPWPEHSAAAVFVGQHSDSLLTARLGLLAKTIRAPTD